MHTITVINLIHDTALYVDGEFITCYDAGCDTTLELNNLFKKAIAASAKLNAPIATINIGKTGDAISGMDDWSWNDIVDKLHM